MVEDPVEVVGDVGVVRCLIDDGTGDSPDDLLRIRDRVGALGGRLAIDGSRVQVVIPCG